MTVKHRRRNGIVAVSAVILVLVVTFCLTNRSLFPHHSPPSEGGTFEFVLLRQMASDSPDRNLCISPLSAQAALYMVYNGAGGQTRKSIAKVMGRVNTDATEVNKSYSTLAADLCRSGEQVKLRSINSVWVDNSLSLKPGFSQICRDIYGAELNTADFRSRKARSEINRWIRKNTRCQIRDTFPKMGPVTGVVLINTLDFSGLWTYPFSQERTKPESFTLSDGQEVSVPIMEHFVVCRNYTGDGFMAAALPYLDSSTDRNVGRYAMYVFLPDKRLGLDGFLDMLNDKNWKKWMAGFERGTVVLKLPRFEVMSDGDAVMQSALAAMGMEEAFKPGADFSRMSDSPLWVDKIVQMTRVRVDEKGTEAAASTEVAFPQGGSPLKMTVDRPFFFAIRDEKTGTLLFTGLVYDPRRGG